jgi:riboflavin kinase/FMN adenylyltransferase
MLIFTATDAIPASLRRAVLAIGNFDGVHRGHQVLIARARERAAKRGAAAGVMVFEPHPRTLFRPDEPFFRLTSLERKTELLARLALDLTVIIPFDRALANLTADAFIDAVIRDRLSASGVVVGDDFKFGKGRGGTVETLTQRGPAAGFTVDVVPKVTGEADKAAPAYSSSSVRAALAAGDVAHANAVLGYRWTVDGTVVDGAKLGTSFGFPTANIELLPGIELRHGIYAVRVRANGRWWDGAGYYGGRPSVDAGPARLEVFLFGFSGNLYDQKIAVEFVAFLRGDQKFDTFEQLRTQMAADCAEAAAQIAAVRAADPLSGLPLAESLVLK